jgi:hypothetical protein
MSVSYSRRITILFTFTILLGWGADSMAAKKVKHSPLGPTGIIGIWDPKGGINVEGVEPGSPADGVLKKGDVVVASGEVRFGRRGAADSLTQAVLKAESNEGSGKMPLTLKDGREVMLNIPVLGSFSSTAPYDCKKTDKIITGAADGLLKEISEGLGRKRLGTSHTNIGLLGLMATGEEKYMEAAYKIIREDFGSITYAGKSLQTLNREQVAKGEAKPKMISAWTTAYALIPMAEYYLLTRDENILPAIKLYSLSLIEGQDSAGLYGHNMADPTFNRVPGYGQMNHPSLAGYLGLILAKKCGIDVPGLDEALTRSRHYVKYHVGRGTFPYGFHGPREDEWNNNGISGLAAICMALEGETEAASFFARCAAASFKSLGRGHGSSLFSTYWTQAGANVVGPHTTQAFFPRAHFYFIPRRKWDGSIAKQYREGHMGGVVLLTHCLPRKALMITGREADQSLWLNESEAREVVAMGDLTIKDVKLADLPTYFGHAFPQPRAQAVAAFMSETTGKKYERLVEKEPGEAKAIRKQVQEMFPQFETMLASGSEFERRNALRCYLTICPEDQLAARMETIGTILRNAEESDEIRAIAVQQLASRGGKPNPTLTICSSS